jgi:hypothetical protein
MHVVDLSRAVAADSAELAARPSRVWRSQRTSEGVGIGDGDGDEQRAAGGGVWGGGGGEVGLSFVPSIGERPYVPRAPLVRLAPPRP